MDANKLKKIVYIIHVIVWFFMVILFMEDVLTWRYIFNLNYNSFLGNFLYTFGDNKIIFFILGLYVTLFMIAGSFFAIIFMYNYHLLNGYKINNLQYFLKVTIYHSVIYIPFVFLFLKLLDNPWLLVILIITVIFFHLYLSYDYIKKGYSIELIEKSKFLFIFAGILVFIGLSMLLNKKGDISVFFIVLFTIIILFTIFLTIIIYSNYIILELFFFKANTIFRTKDIKFFLGFVFSIAVIYIIIFAFLNFLSYKEKNIQESLTYNLFFNGLFISKTPFPYTLKLPKYWIEYINHNKICGLSEFRGIEFNLSNMDNLPINSQERIFFYDINNTRRLVILLKEVVPQYQAVINNKFLNFYIEDYSMIYKVLDIGCIKR